MVKGACYVEIKGIANNLNIGGVSLIYKEMHTSEEAEEPSGEQGDNPAPVKKGCGGSIVAASSLLGLIVASGASLILIKRKREN